MIKRNPSLLCRALIASLLVCFPLSLDAAQRSRERVHFQRGRTTVVLKGAVLRGERKEYLLGARAGQRMTAHITSVEKNAVFDVFNRRGPVGEVETTDWENELPETGDYSIIVSSVRGNATYTLEVTIR